ncbi:hypothetical protein J6590_051954 [Homalodisca vitripennis]|nr:hypothetical protein J6590_051954 [Homalodisca vitripennis]
MEPVSGARTVRRRPGKGHSKSNRHKEDRLLRVNALCNRFSNAKELQNDLSLVTGTRISDKTVRNRRREAGMRSRRPVLDIHIRLRAGRAVEDVVYVQDEARPHAARVERQYLDVHNIPVLERTACSPDLNPIEHVLGPPNLPRQPQTTSCHHAITPCHGVYKQLSQQDEVT